MRSVDPRYEKVRRTQVAIFKEQGYSGDDHDLIRLLGPEVLASYLGLDYIEREELPSNDPRFKTAGILDRVNRRIYVSKEFPIEQRRLTGMHEVVHWMLHEHVGRDHMHRDRPIGHEPKQWEVDYYEWEATHIACLCLMPERLVMRRFAATFELDVGQPIDINESTAFFMNRDIEELLNMDQRKRALTLATASIFRRPVIPLHEWFKISPTAMAIRLEEMNLIAPERWRGKPNLRVVS